MLMLLKIRCQGCGSPLRVPERSSGMKARCPACKKIFVIPAPDQLIQDTFATWIYEDVESEYLNREERFGKLEEDQLAREKAYWSGQHPPAGKRSPSISEKTVTAHAAMPDGQAKASAPKSPPRPATKHAAMEPASHERVHTAASPALPSHDEKPSAPPDDSSAMPLEPVVATQPESQAQAGPIESSPAVAPTPIPPPAPAPAPAPAPEGREAAAPASGNPRHGSWRARLVPRNEPTKYQPVPRQPSEAADATATQPDAADGPQFPREPLDKNRPELLVKECRQSGTILAFDCRCLEHEGFRASMPMTCVFSGKRDVHHLLHRPLAFVDRSQAVVRSAQEIEGQFEQHVPIGSSVRDVMKSMVPIAHLPIPFNNPMPYFVHEGHRDNSLACSTHKQSTGGFMCEVLFPDGRMALEWLGRVNGLCGVEYGMLQQELALLSQDTWQSLPETARQRLVIWCKFQPRERFKLYLNDAEFGQRDYGLAGIVITDRRLVFHKFHHNSELDLSADCRLMVRNDGPFLAITAVAGDHRAKLAQIAQDDLSKLIDCVRGSRADVVIARD